MQKEKFYLFRAWCIYDHGIYILKQQIDTSISIIHRHTPYHTKRSLVYSQALRVGRICLFENDTIRHRNETKSCFLNRVYSKALIDKKVSKVKFLNTFWDKRTQASRITLVIRSHPLLKDFVKVVNSFNCNNKCTTNLLTYNKCKMQYVGKTIDNFRLQWNNYKDNKKHLTKEVCMQQHLFEHFSSKVQSGFLHDVSIIFTDKTN